MYDIFGCYLEVTFLLVLIVLVYGKWQRIFLTWEEWVLAIPFYKLTSIEVEYIEGQRV